MNQLISPLYPVDPLKQRWLTQNGLWSSFPPIESVHYMCLKTIQPESILTGSCPKPLNKVVSKNVFYNGSVITHTLFAFTYSEIVS